MVPRPIRRTLGKVRLAEGWIVLGVSEALPDGVMVQQVELQLLLPARLVLTHMAGEAVVESLTSLMKSHIFFCQLFPPQHSDDN